MLHYIFRRLISLVFLFPFVAAGQFVEEDRYTPRPIRLEDYGMAGKGIFSVSVIAAGSYDEINTGVTAINKKDTNNKKDVMLGPGGGLGLEVFGGKQINKHIRMGRFGGLSAQYGQSGNRRCYHPVQ